MRVLNRLGPDVICHPGNDKASTCPVQETWAIGTISTVANVKQVESKPSDCSRGGICSMTA